MALFNMICASRIDVTSASSMGPRHLGRWRVNCAAGGAAFRQEIQAEADAATHFHVCPWHSPLEITFHVLLSQAGRWAVNCVQI